MLTMESIIIDIAIGVMPLIAEKQCSESVVLLKMGEELALGNVVRCDLVNVFWRSSLYDHSAIMTDLPVWIVEKALRIKPSQ